MSRIETPFDTTPSPSNRSVSRRGFLGRILRGSAGTIAARTLSPIAAATSPFWAPLAEKAVVAAAPAEQPTFGLPDGMFFTTNSEADGGVEGFSVIGPMWEAYQKYGGKDNWGPPLSTEHRDNNGRRVQFFHKGAFQINDNGTVEWMNINGELDDRVRKGQLTGKTLEKYNQNFMPSFRDWSSDDGKSWGHTAKGPNPGSKEENHIGTIFGELDRYRDANPMYLNLKKAYFENPMWFEQYGLPMSWQWYGNLVVVNCQRAALQLWTTKREWTDYPGQVVASNAGIDAKEFGLILQEYLIPQKLTQAKFSPPQELRTIEQIKSPEMIGEFKNKVGWAYSARPENSFDDMLAAMKSMKAEGANIVYIGHINPNEVENKPAEPGLGFAVYYARKTGYNKEAQVNAEGMFQGVMRALEAAKQAGLAVVLPIGYQIEMGEQWIRENDAHLRKNPDGSNMNHWGNKGVGETASPYSPKYRQDIAKYYKWVQDEIIAKYPNILAINLGDEPMGGDFSTWAKQEFQRTHNGVNYDSADPKSKGEFQSGVLADYAAWSANFWKELNPKLRTMMTFHIQREVLEFPNIEKVFQETPDTFIPAPDFHLHDAPADSGISESDINLCFGMSRYLGWLSNVYNREIMVWTSANDWGLDNKPGTLQGGGINEARLNLRIVTDVAKQNGAKIAMIMAWGYNMGEQGLYQGTPGKRPYDADNMFRQISSDMKARRDTLSEQMSGRPDIVIYVPADALYRRIDAEKISHVIDRNNPWVDLNRYDFKNQNIVYLTDGPALERAKREGSKIIQVAV